jgi:hypothetical protein
MVAAFVATVLLLTASPAVARERVLDRSTCDDSPLRAPRPVSVRPFPVVAGFRVRFVSQTLTTAADGTFAFDTTVAACDIVRQLVPVTRRVPVASGHRLVFRRWYGGAGRAYTATFTDEYAVVLRFRDPRGVVVDPLRVDRVVLRSSISGNQRFDADEQLWLPGRRSVLNARGFGYKPIWWTLQSATVHGLEVARQSALRFVPAPNARPDATLLLFRVRVHAADALFGRDVGRTVKLIYPNGFEDVYELDGGARATIESVPRGQYDLVVHGSGLPMRSAAAITRDQDVDLKVISYLDVAVAGLVGIGALAGLALFGRRRYRRRVRLGAAPGGSPWLAPTR